MSEVQAAPNGATLTAKDFATDQDIRWCPGCGDYSILKQVHTIMPQLNVKREDIVFISGIGCSSRFPYYTNTFGMHSIHGRATAIASGLKATRPELSVWLVTGDGDALSIGGNHFIHLMRKNFDINVLLFNNQIYGLTKGQYSPTSEEHKVTKSTPHGSIDHPFIPPLLALGAESTFVARSMDVDPAHLQNILLKGYQHKGTSFIEIYQNCNIFNDGAFETWTAKGTKKEEGLFMVHGQPLTFGADGNKGIYMDGMKPVVVNLAEGSFSKNDLWIHDETDLNKALILARMFDHPSAEHHMPRPFGIFYRTDRPTYESMMQQQIDFAVEKKGRGNLDKLIAGGETWTIA